MAQTTSSGRSAGSSPTRVMNVDVGTRTAPGARTSSNSFRLADVEQDRAGRILAQAALGLGDVDRRDRRWHRHRALLRRRSGGPRVGPSGWAARSARRRVDRGDERVEVDAGRRCRPVRSSRASTEQGARALEVAGDPRRVAADVVDVRGGDLDQALEERPLGGIVACPSRPARAPRAPRRSRRARRRPARPPAPPPAPRPGAAGTPWPVRPRPTTTDALGHASSASGRRPENPVSSPCHQPIDGLAALPAQPDLPAGRRAPGSRPGRARCRAGSGRARRSGRRRPPSGRSGPASGAGSGAGRRPAARRPGAPCRLARSATAVGGTVARPAPGGQHLVAQPDELGALLGEQARRSRRARGRRRWRRRGRRSGSSVRF